MAYSKPRILNIEGQTVAFAHPTEVEGALKTYLSADLAATGTAVTLIDNVGLANKDVIRYGEFGEKSSEIKSINGAVTAGTSITSVAVTFAHAANTPITKMLYDQFDVYGSATEDGAKTTIAAGQPLQANNFSNTYTSSAAYSFYFIRFYNSLATTPFYSAYSDAIPAAGFNVNTVFNVKKAGLSETKTIVESDKESIVSHDYLDTQINLCLEDIRGKRNRWSWLQSIDTDLGNLSYLMRSVPMPSDIYDSNTNRSVESLRIGGGQPLVWIPWDEYQESMKDTAYTQVATQAPSGALSLEVDDSVDFTSSGVLQVGTQEASVAYTANSSNEFTITAGELTATATVDTHVWQNATVGRPKFYTIAGGNIYLYPVPDSAWSTQNILIDYYKSVTSVNSEGDTLDMIRWDAVKDWLCWKILSRKKQYEEANIYKEDYYRKVNEMIIKERGIKTYHFSPAKNNLNEGSPSSWDKRD